MSKTTILKSIFSITNDEGRHHKVITFCGLKLAIKRNSSFKIKINKNGKKNILLISHDLTPTGAPYVLLDISRLLRDKYNIFVWSIDGGALYDEFINLNIKPTILNDVNYKKCRAYYKELKKCDYVIVNTIVNDFWANLCKECCLPYIWYIHEAKISEIIKPNYNEIKEILKNNQENIYVVSDYAKSYFSKTFDVNTKVINNFTIDTYRNKTNEYSDVIQFTFVGTIDPNKGLKYLCQALNSLPLNLACKYQLNIAGKFTNEYYKREILSLIENNKNIKYWEQVSGEEKLKLFELTNVFVVPSLDESSSRVTLEACMMGRPVIVTENVGAKYMITHNTGWIVQSGSSEELKNCIEEIINNPTQLKIMGENARAKYLETSTEEIYKAKLLEIIEEKTCI
ncbi:MAG: glycosyltransferase family 4 protein [Candidatus Gastranaerophilaceae bacterium]